MNILIKEMRFMGNYDMWGTSMQAWFDVASELWWRGEAVPDHWEYSPGCADDPREPDSYLSEYCGELDTETLIKAGNILCRYTAVLEKHGEGY